MYDHVGIVLFLAVIAVFGLGIVAIVLDSPRR
jgi:hypothetical protein